jgi:hypothetical protein
MENLERKKRFDQYISNKALEGYIIVDKNQENLSAVLSKKGAEKINHTLHAILTLLTCFWGIVWLIKYNQAGAGKESRIRFSIDESGNMVEEKIG